MMRTSFILLVFLTNLCCVDDPYETLAKELQVYLPEGVTAVVAYKDTEREQVRIRWEKPLVVYDVVLNAPDDAPAPKGHVHDPISIRLVPDTNLKEIYAHKARYFAVKSSVIEWTEKLKNMPGIQGKDWAFSGPEEWLSSAKPKTDEEKRLVADYEAFVKNEYLPVMAKRRDCPNFIFKRKFILLESQLDRVSLAFEPDGVTAIQNMLHIIEVRCTGSIEKY